MRNQGQHLCVFILLILIGITAPLDGVAAAAGVSLGTDAAQIPINRLGNIRKAIESNNTPINFWGKIVDQDEKPVGGAKVKLRTLIGSASVKGVVGESQEVFETQTDVIGTFSLISARGYSLLIESISKDGYELSPKIKLTMDTYGSPERPVVFRMW